MGWYGLLLLVALPAYFIYAVYSSIRSARLRRDEAAAQFGTIREHPQEDWESLERQWKLQASESTYTVDDITWNDLDMNQVFHRINGCLTTPGEEILYNRLRSLPDPEEDWESALSFLDKNPQLRKQLQTLLNHLGKNSESGLFELIHSPDLYRLPFVWAIRFTSLLPIGAAALFFLPLPPGSGFVALLPALAINIALYYWGQKKLQGKLHTMRYIKALLWCSKKLAHLNMQGLEKQQEDIKRNFRPFSKLHGSYSGTVQEGMSAGDVGALMMFPQIFFLTELRAYNRAMDHIAAHISELADLYRAVGRMDLIISVLSFRKSLNRFCTPQFHKDMALCFEGSVHPLLQEGVENSAKLSRGTLITGSNASGKSTFLKTLAVNAILAQSIHTCTAAFFALPRARVLSSMALRDSLQSGESYFIVEIKSFRRILKAVQYTPCLCFVDEILRGTNTIERIAASAAVLKSLQQDNSLCLAATHDIELAAMLAGSYENYHFQEKLEGNSIRFDYKLRSGPSVSRNALLLLEAFDFPISVVQKAKQMVEYFENEKHWPAPETMNGGDTPEASQAG